MEPARPIESPPTAEPAKPTRPPILAAAPELAAPGSPSASNPPAEPGELRLFLQEVRSKMARLAEDFAQGRLNRMQFQEIYAHYQQQRQTIEATIVGSAAAEPWPPTVAAGLTSILKERHAARVLSYAIYDNTTSLPLASVGEFRVDTGLLIPMLSSFRSATAEMFGAGLRSTEIEGGRWLCFVPGRYTTLMVLFSVDPARIQLTLIEDLHRDFEVANRAALAAGRGREAAELFTRLWALDKMYSP